MQWTDIKKDWKSLSKDFKVKWAKLTDEDLKAIDGKRDVLVKRLQPHYKLTQGEIEKQVDAFATSLKVAKPKV